MFEVFGAIFSNRFALIMDGVKADVEEIKRPVTAVGNFFKKITGKEVEAPKEPTKNQLKLREKVEQFRAERKEKRELHKQELIEKRKQKKIDEKAQKEAQKQEKEDRKAAIAIENKLLKSAEKQEKSAQKQEKRLQKKALPAPPAEDTATSVQPFPPRRKPKKPPHISPLLPQPATNKNGKKTRPKRSPESFGRNNKQTNEKQFNKNKSAACVTTQTAETLFTSKNYIFSSSFRSTPFSPILMISTFTLSPIFRTSST